METRDDWGSHEIIIQRLARTHGPQHSRILTTLLERSLHNMPVAVTTAVPLSSTSGPRASSTGNVSAVSLVTAPFATKTTYHLMEVTPDLLVHFTKQMHKDDSASAASSSTSASGRRGRAPEHGGNGSDEEECTLGQRGPNKRAKTLCIKGRNDDEAVLCTDDNTWQVRQMTQSNSLLLCSFADDVTTRGETSTCALSVRTNVVEILELVPVVPRMGRIQSVLAASAYAGEEEEEIQTKVRRYTPQQVASIVQASPRELQDGLCLAHVVELDGYHRMVAPAFLLEALRVLLAHLDAHTISHRSVLAQSAIDALVHGCEMRDLVAEAIITRFFGSVIISDEEGAPRHVALDAEAIVRFVGLQLLASRASAKPMLEEEFLDEWATIVGLDLGSNIDLELLRGNFLRNPAPPNEPSATEPATIQFFAASDLPLDVGPRFQHLFRARPQWTFDDLKPFLADVAIDDKKRDALLLKFARTSDAKLPVPETKQERRARRSRGEADNPPMRSVKLYSARLRY